MAILTTPVMPSNDCAMKEWACIVQALREGVQTVVLRKGGIEEEGDSFELKRDEFFLFPTYEHQTLEALAPRYQRFYSAPPEDRSNLSMDTYAQVVETHALRRASHLEPFSHLHILSHDYLQERFLAKPDDPMWLFVLRAYRMGQPLSIPNETAYDGCRSWVTLKQEIPTASAQPVLSDERLEEVLDSVRTIVSALPRS
ncbi:MAG: DUF1802 family protein [Acidobacteria bacterium]|nr:DUF1802 family protein [Acidobacteriota bacterium]